MSEDKEVPRRDPERFMGQEDKQAFATVIKKQENFLDKYWGKSDELWRAEENIIAHDSYKLLFSELSKENQEIVTGKLFDKLEEKRTQIEKSKAFLDGDVSIENSKAARDLSWDRFDSTTRWLNEENIELESAEEQDKESIKKRIVRVEGEQDTARKAFLYAVSASIPTSVDKAP